MRSRTKTLVLTAASVVMLTEPSFATDIKIAEACLGVVESGLRDLAVDRKDRFLGKVDENRALCRGGDVAVAGMPTPWVDWANYWAAGDAESKATASLLGGHIFDRNLRGIDGALVDLEYQRMELIKFNLFDNNGTFHRYLTGEIGGGKHVDGATIQVWTEMRLPVDHPNFRGLEVQSDGTQLCKGSLIRFRTPTGICNDPRNPAMGSSGQLFARNVEFESTFPELEMNEYARNRHGGRIGLLQPDPQLISRALFTRDQSHSPDCNEGRGVSGRQDADCEYKKASFFNVLAAFWIQFMTHDWFTHLDNARNDESRILTNLGCSTAEAVRLGCRKEDKIDAALVAQSDRPGRSSTRIVIG